MRKLLFLLSLSILFLSCGAEGGGNDAKEIQIKQTKGSTYDYNQNSTMDISQKIGPQTIDMTINMVSNMTFEVTDIADGIYTLKTQMNRLKMSLKNAGMDIDADSDVEVSDDGNIMQQLFSMMVKEVTNKPFVVKMNNKGNVESVKGVDTLFESAIGVLASKFPEIGEDKISATLSQMK